MKCVECGGTYDLVHGDIQIEDEYVGPLQVKDVDYRKCNGCGEVLYPLQTSRIIEQRWHARYEELIQREPLNAFLTAKQTADAFGISRQALHKHRRISRGFIYSIMIGGVKLYHRKSVRLFKEIEDGRFALYKLEPVRVSGESRHNTSYVSAQCVSKQVFAGNTKRFNSSAVLPKKTKEKYLGGLYARQERN